MLTKQTVIGMISILEDNQIQVRTDTVLYEDNVELSRTYHRGVYSPGDEVDKPEVKQITDIIWTPEVIAAYKEKTRKALEKLPFNIGQ